MEFEKIVYNYFYENGFINPTPFKNQYFYITEDNENPDCSYLIVLLDGFKKEIIFNVSQFFELIQIGAYITEIINHLKKDYIEFIPKKLDVLVLHSIKQLSTELIGVCIQNSSAIQSAFEVKFISKDVTSPFTGNMTKKSVVNLKKHLYYMDSSKIKYKGFKGI